MEYTIHQIIDYYANATIIFKDIFKAKLERGKIDRGRYTAPNMYGLVIPFRGRANFSFKGTVYKMHPQMIVHAGSEMDIVIEPTSAEPWEYAVVHYTIADEEKTIFPQANEHFAIKLDENIKLIELVSQLEKHYATPGNTAKLQAKVLFMQLIEEILMCAKRQIHCSNDSITEVISYIHEHYNSIASVTELAEQFDIERRRFAYLFMRSTGMSPVQYITEIRLKRAQELLRMTSYSVASIAEYVGYQDHFYFSRLFKKHVGVSPSIYRKYVEKNNLFLQEKK